MRKTIWKHMVYALFLSLMVLGCSGLGGALDGSNATHAKNVVSLSPIMPVYGADLMITSMYIHIDDCIPALTGTRRITFSYKIRNIGGAISPNYLTMLSDQNGFLGGGAGLTLIPAGQYVSKSFGKFVPTGTRDFAITIYPINPQFFQGGGGPWTNYINRTLDINPNNNAAHYKIFVPDCPPYQPTSGTKI